ncbi:hypothetical protein G6F55_014546 [Rhizopus delemar]|nr:hypothetical protein G6F55_014546 [Rhizopus delemar]
MSSSSRVNGPSPWNSWLSAPQAAASLSASLGSAGSAASPVSSGCLIGGGAGAGAAAAFGCGGAPLLAGAACTGTDTTPSARLFL